MSVVIASQQRLCELQIPVACDAPHELVGGARGLVELVRLDRSLDLADRTLRLTGDPAIERVLDRLRIEDLVAVEAGKPPRSSASIRAAA